MSNKDELDIFFKKISKNFNKKILKYLHVPTLNNKDLKFIKNTLTKNEVSTYGTATLKFEKKLKKYYKSPYVISTNNGTSAMHSILFCLNLNKNDEVFVQSLTFVGSVNPILYVGANPHFVDCEKTNLCLDVEKLEQYIEKNFDLKKRGLFNKKSKRYVRAIIVTHIFGMSPNMTKLKLLCKKYKLILIEDAAESIGSKFNGKHLGTFGSFSIVSFNGNKTITTGGGGAILLKDKRFYKNILSLITVRKDKRNWEDKHLDIGFNYRMPSINAALGISQLNKLTEILNKKKRVFNIYKKLFKNNKVFKIMESNYNSETNHWLIAGYIKLKSLKIKQVIYIAKKNSIHLKPIWSLNHKMKNLSKFPRMNLDNSIDLEKKIVCFPSSPKLINLTNEE